MIESGLPLSIGKEFNVIEVSKVSGEGSRNMVRGKCKLGYDIEVGLVLVLCGAMSNVTVHDLNDYEDDSAYVTFDNTGRSPSKEPSEAMK